MESLLAVVGSVLAGFAALDALRPGRGAGERALRGIGGGALLALAIAAASTGAYAGATIAGAVALPLLVAPVLPRIFSHVGRLQANRHGHARPHQT